MHASTIANRILLLAVGEPLEVMFPEQLKDSADREKWAVLHLCG